MLNPENPLTKEILSEVDLLEALNIEQPQLDVLRLTKDFPFIPLNSRNRVYLVSDVLGWLKNHSDKR